MMTQQQGQEAAGTTPDGKALFEIDGNRLVPIVNGPARMEALLALIGSARRELRLLYYIFAADGAGIAVRDALIVACLRGVAVSLLIDGFGSEETPNDFLAPLRDAGGVVCRFLPRFGRRYLLRNHQKMAVADDRWALIGGFNIEAGYFAADGEEEGWRDFALSIEGSAVPHLAGYFDAVLSWARTPRAKMRTLNRAISSWSHRDGRLRWLFGGPTQRLSPWTRALRQDLGHGNRLDMISAYFAPNPGMLRRVSRLARRGRVRIMTAARSDNSMTIAAARHCYIRLLRRGARIWEYRAMRLHTKLFLVDDIAYIGSANFDMRSLYINLEVMLRIEDAGLAEWLRNHFEHETTDAQAASLQRIRTRAGWLMRLKWRLAYFVVTVVDYTVTRRVNFHSPGDEVG